MIAIGPHDSWLQAWVRRQFVCRSTGPDPRRVVLASSERKRPRMVQGYAGRGEGLRMFVVVFWQVVELLALGLLGSLVRGLGLSGGLLGAPFDQRLVLAGLSAGDGGPAGGRVHFDRSTIPPSRPSPALL